MICPQRKRTNFHPLCRFDLILATSLAVSNFSANCMSVLYAPTYPYHFLYQTTYSDPNCSQFRKDLIESWKYSAHRHLLARCLHGMDLGLHFLCTSLLLHSIRDLPIQTARRPRLSWYKETVLWNRHSYNGDSSALSLKFSSVELSNFVVKAEEQLDQMLKASLN